MAKKTETEHLTPTEALRKGWLAYIGLYGAAYERVKPLSAKAAATFEDLVAKGETVEDQAQDVVETVRERTNGFYGAGFERFRAMIPAIPVPARRNRVDELEAEIAALNKKVASLSKKPAVKRTRKKAA